MHLYTTTTNSLLSTRQFCSICSKLRTKYQNILYAYHVDLQNLLLRILGAVLPDATIPLFVGYHLQTIHPSQIFVYRRMVDLGNGYFHLATRLNELQQ
ncbi:hypothetical protein D3C81_1254260 [compost metagenome]